MFMLLGHETQMTSGYLYKIPSYEQVHNLRCLRLGADLSSSGQATHDSTIALEKLVLSLNPQFPPFVSSTSCHILYLCSVSLKGQK